MKKLILFSLIISSLMACRKDDDDDDSSSGNTFANRIVGTWDLTDVDYDFELPSIIPGTPATQITGSATNVTGSFVIAADPNTISYDYTFDVSLNGIGTVPVNTQESGTWTLSNDETVIFLQLSDGSTSQLEILQDTKTIQKYNTTITETAPVVGDLDILTTITLAK